jgi:hypothetical protein
VKRINRPLRALFTLQSRTQTASAIERVLRDKLIQAHTQFLDVHSFHRDGLRTSSSAARCDGPEAGDGNIRPDTAGES